MDQKAAQTPAPEIIINPGHKNRQTQILNVCQARLAQIQWIEHVGDADVVRFAPDYDLAAHFEIQMGRQTARQPGLG